MGSSLPIDVHAVVALCTECPGALAETLAVYAVDRASLRADDIAAAVRPYMQRCDVHQVIENDLEEGCTAIAYQSEGGLFTLTMLARQGRPEVEAILWFQMHLFQSVDIRSKPFDLMMTPASLPRYRG